MRKKAPLFHLKYLLHDIFKWFMSWKVLLFWRIKKYYDGKEAKQKIHSGAVIVSNHVGFVDPFVIQGTVLYRRFHFLAMEELMKTRFQKWWYKKVFLTYPISRDTPSLKTIRYCSDLVNEGNLIALFPEGHIKTSDDKVDDFKGGAVLIAYKANAPIIPIYHVKRTSIWHRTRMVIGKPIYPKDLLGEKLTQEKIMDVSNYLKDYMVYLESVIHE